MKEKQEIWNRKSLGQELGKNLGYAVLIEIAKSMMTSDYNEDKYKKIELIYHGKVLTTDETKIS